MRSFVVGREFNTADTLALLETFVPVSKTMAEDIERRRKRLDGVAKLAGGEVKLAQPKPVRRISSVAGRN